MRIIVKHNIDKKIYHAYIPLVGYRADIPEEVFSKDTLLELMMEYTQDQIGVEIMESLDRSKAIPLILSKAKPHSGKWYLSIVRSLTDYNLKEYPYLTVDYSGKIFIHKDYPHKDSGDDYWSSEVHEPIGYLPESILTTEEDNDEMLYDSVFKCIE